MVAPRVGEDGERDDVGDLGDRHHGAPSEGSGLVEQGLKVRRLRVEDRAVGRLTLRRGEAAVHAASRMRVEFDVPTLDRVRVPTEQLRVERCRLLGVRTDDLEPRDRVAQGVLLQIGPAIGAAERAGSHPTSALRQADPSARACHDPRVRRIIRDR